MNQTKSRVLSSVGIPSIDAEHRNLQVLIDSLEASVKRRDDLDDVLRQFAEIFEIWHAHCQNEERLLKKRGSPRLAEMKAEHDRLRHRVAKLSEQYEADPEKFETGTAFSKIRRMAIRHVNEYDAPAFRDLSDK